ncbi:NUDIX hydrolase [Streptococcus cuniculi]|uniref:8-oxo-dGTP diphosphatase n=1 Tax=Streptococcus cuniculi TaxID=1432788 RepID=A0A4Y9JDK8_9STRE|nr:NUDIX hydrolase [Streptococcus cuniculi]MBF0777986.1 NUDIX hydrolase [Streptococcus cuniculi]TFU98278.1 NUDIX hydrolase [Streptococcus cuniculi]
MTEYWNAYLETGEKIDIILERDKSIPKGIYHLVVECIITHKDGSVLFMQRDSTKPAFPNYFEATAGGSVLLDEDPKTASLREVHEETGIQLKASQLIHHHHFVAHKHQCIFDLYWAEVNCKKDSIILQEGETTDFIWVARKDLPTFLEHALVIPRQKEYVERLFLEKE